MNLLKIINFYKRHEEIISYLMVGFLTTLVNLIVKYLLLFFAFDAQKDIELQSAVFISWIVAVIFAYITNRKFVFMSKNNDIFRELVNFVSSRIVTLLMEMIFMWFFISLLKLNSDNYVIIFSIIAQILVIIGNYIFSKLFVFKK